MYGGPHSLLFTYNSPIVKKPHLALQQTFRRSTCKTISRVRVIPARCLRVSNRDLSLKYPSLLTRDGGYLPKRQTGTSAVREAALTSALADSSLEVVVNVSLDGTGKCSNSTTLPFLDHMLDQLGTHGLLDVSVEVRGRTQDIADEQVNGAVGNALGQVFADLGLSEHHVTSTFSAPLDESLVGATVSLDGPSQLTYDVGFPTTLVGTYETRLPELFFQKFIQASGMSVSLVRQTPNNRGNSHHIIEATFKAFARALRAAIDEVDQRSVEGTLVKREATIHRKTGETDVNVAIMLDGKGSSDCDTMIPHLDLMLKELAETSGISFKVECEGALINTNLSEYFLKLSSWLSFRARATPMKVVLTGSVLLTLAYIFPVCSLSLYMELLSCSVSQLPPGFPAMLTAPDGRQRNFFKLHFPSFRCPKLYFPPFRCPKLQE